MANYNNPIGLNRHLPIKIRWNGFESNTAILQQSGWEINADEYVSNEDYQKVISIGIIDPSKKIFLQGRFVFPCGIDLQEINYTERQYLEYFHVDMGVYTIKDMVRVMEQMDYKSILRMRPIDAMEPTYSSSTQIYMRDFDFFKYQSPQEIYIPSDSVDECLNRILQLQYPDQADIKKKIIMPENKSILQAKIITLAA